MLVETGAERFAQDEDRVLKRGAKGRREVLGCRAQRVHRGGEIGRRKVVLERATHLEAQVRAHSLERRLDLQQTMPLRDERVVAGGELARGHPEELALEAVAEQAVPRAGAGTP